MMTFLTGGASCGKSAEAERLCLQAGGARVYLAAMRPFGEEGERRVAKHRAQRAGKGFATIECYERFDAVLEDERIVGATVLLECLGNVVANELFGAGVVAKAADDEGGSEVDRLVDRVAGVIAELDRLSGHLVIVGNEVGGDGVGYPRETRVYQEAIGALSRRVASQSDVVIECVAGIPVTLSTAAAR